MWRPTLIFYLKTVPFYKSQFETKVNAQMFWGALCSISGEKLAFDNWKQFYQFVEKRQRKAFGKFDGIASGIFFANGVNLDHRNSLLFPVDTNAKVVCSPALYSKRGHLLYYILDSFTLFVFGNLFVNCEFFRAVKNSGLSLKRLHNALSPQSFCFVVGNLLYCALPPSERPSKPKNLLPSAFFLRGCCEG